MITSALAAIAALLASATFIWTAGIILIVAMAILLEKEREGWATTCFSLGIALILWNYKEGIWEWLSTNPTATIGFVVAYVVAGIVWSFLKWRSYLVGIFTKFKEIKHNFTLTNGQIDKDNLKHFNSLIHDEGFKTYGPNTNSSSTVEEQVLRITPQAAKKKSVITSWISYWPVSLAGTLLNNPFRQFFEWVYSLLSGSYDRMTKHYQQDILGK